MAELQRLYAWMLKDQGVVLKHGQGPDKCDMLGARDFWVYESDGTYYMNYDGSGPKGWLACLATSKNLTDLVQQGPCWISANPERKIPLRLRTA